MCMRRLFLLLGIWGVLWAYAAPIDRLTENPATTWANIGVYIKNLTTGEVIDSYRSRNLIPPASTMKLFSTATALESLGASARYPTIIAYSGYIREGVLHGDLYIRGYGDPTLGNLNSGTNFLYHWSNAVRKAGIRTITGSVIGDASYYDGDALNPGWIWEDVGNYYAPGIFAIAYMDNTCNVQLRSGPVGSVATVIKTLPDIPGLTFENHIRCTEIDYDGAFVHGLPYQNCRYLTGSVPSNRGIFGVQGDIPNPPLLLAQHFTARLLADGVEVQGAPRYLSESDNRPTTQLYTHYSDTLGSIIAETNMRSINLYAEMIFRNLGARRGLPCTIHNAAEIVRDFWRNRGVDLRTAQILDGCGLAPQDAISAEHFVNLLEYMNRSTNREVFEASLPVSGVSGTLKFVLAGTELQGRVHAKSGTIKGTKNYAGYILMPNGDRWAFAVLVNSATGKQRQIQRAIEQYLLDVYQANK